MIEFRGKWWVLYIFEWIKGTKWNLFDEYWMACSFSVIGGLGMVVEILVWKYLQVGVNTSLAMKSLSIS